MARILTLVLGAVLISSMDSAGQIQVFTTQPPVTAPGMPVQIMGNPPKVGWSFARSCGGGFGGLCMRSPYIPNTLAPAVQACRARGVNIDGPFPADTVFVRAMRGEFDAVVACYHDQGLIPVKLLAFGRAVNVTLGLPIVRTSVDHGTAFDIAGRGVADPSSLIEAVRLCRQSARECERASTTSRCEGPDASPRCRCQ